jgi:hypothetical protein
MVVVMRTQIVVVACIAFGGAASADIVWNEFDDGDLSGNPDAPTPLVFAMGGNTIIGSIQAPNDIRDYITFTLDPGQFLARLLLHQYEDLDTGGPGNRGFHAIIEGDTSFIPDGGNIHLFLGSAHLDPEPPGTDILPNLAAAQTGGQGFDVPLGPGTYTYHVQQTGTQRTGYTLEFVIVPAPGAFALFGAGALWGIACRRRR